MIEPVLSIRLIESVTGSAGTAPDELNAVAKTLIINLGVTYGLAPS